MNKMVRFVPYTTEDTRIFPDANVSKPRSKKRLCEAFAGMTDRDYNFWRPFELSSR